MDPPIGDEQMPVSPSQGNGAAGSAGPVPGQPTLQELIGNLSAAAQALAGAAGGSRTQSYESASRLVKPPDLFAPKTLEVILGARHAAPFHLLTMRPRLCRGNQKKKKTKKKESVCGLGLGSFTLTLPLGIGRCRICEFVLLPILAQTCRTCAGVIQSCA